MVRYEYDSRLLEIAETQDEMGTEFVIRFHETAPYAEWLRKVEHYFERNRDLTDVLFYKYPGPEYRVIVRRDQVVAFLAELFKARLLTRLEWADGTN